MNTLSKRLVALAIALFAVACCTGCPAFWKAAPAALDTAACALAHKDEWSWARIVQDCGLTPENENVIRDLVAKEQARQAAAVAAAKQVGCR